MKQTHAMSYIKGLIAKICEVLCRLFTRQHKAVFGCYKNKFADNSKYLFLHWQLNGFMRAIWISADNQMLEQLNAKGYEAYHRWSLKGIYHSLTAKFYFYSSYVGDINRYTHGGAIKTNLWHGSPLKKIEFDIDQGPLHEVYHSQHPRQKWLKSVKYYQEYVKPDVMLCPSEQVQSLFTSAFKLTKSETLLCSNPRSDFYACYPHRQTDLSKLFNGSYQKVILYAPTWRDSGLTNTQTGVSPYDAGFNWQALSAQLQRNNQLLLIRFHPNEAHLAKGLQSIANIIDISERDDVYDVLKQIDLLITDSSSLFIDVLPNNTPFRFYCFDNEQTATQGVNSQRSHYDYAQSLPLISESDNRWRLTNFEQLQVCLDSDFTALSGQEKQDYERLKQWFWQSELSTSFNAIEGAMFKTTAPLTAKIAP